jgi:hypothetical protein
MMVLSESSARLPPSPSARDIELFTRAAELAGCNVYHIPQDFADCDDAEGALWHLPLQTEIQHGVWIGYIPSLEHYSAIYLAALEKRVRLLNSPEEHRRAQEFDSAYPHLIGLTPESVIITAPSECEAIALDLGFPLFVKGAVQSRKSRGWKACVAESLEDLQRLATAILELEQRSRGRVVVRKLVKLRYVRRSPLGFPLGREYRLFVYDGAVLGMGYYWEGEDSLKDLTATESEQVQGVALEAARRLKVPYIAIDVGQLEDGSWMVIETGDAQFSGISSIPPLKLWHRIAQIQ